MSEADKHAEYFGPELRRQIRAQLADFGAPAEFIDVIADVACNAAHEALKRFDQVLFAFPSQGVQLAALGIALSLLNHRITKMQAVTADIAENVGAVTHHATLQARS